MEFHATAKYPAPLDEVLKMLTSEEFQRVRLADLPVKIKSVQINDGPKKSEVTVTTEIHAKPADLNLPSMADKFIPRQGLTVAMTETWNIDSAQSVLTFDTGGLPVKVSANSKLIDEGDAVTRNVEGTVTVSVPIVGRKLEQRAVAEMGEIVRAEESAARKYLEN
ncbi:MAG: DUF2505 domain-containing protein [Gleimia sp.]|nr:DUF2505 domain-containing protein [Acidobacteriota bacterium]